MSHQDEINHQQDLLGIHRQTLGIYIKQRAMHGEAYTPAAIIISIREARKQIRRVKNILRSWGLKVDDLPDDDLDDEDSILTNDKIDQTPSPFPHDVLRAELEDQHIPPLLAEDGILRNSGQSGKNYLYDGSDNEAGTLVVYTGMPDRANIEQHILLLEAHRRTLAHYRQQQAMLGKAYAPPGVTAGILDACENIRQIKSILRTWEENVEDYPDDDLDDATSLSAYSAPQQAPLPLPHYVARVDAEEQLMRALTAEDGIALTVLYGLSGMGKSALAAHVVRKLYQDQHFPDGVLWGSLDNLTAEDLLLGFLGALDSEWYRRAPSASQHLRDLLWRTIAGRRVLVVLDNVSNARQLADLLPPEHGALGDCRVLAISISRLEPPPYRAHPLSLGHLSEPEALQIFQKVFAEHQDQAKVELYDKALREISRRLEYMPQLVITAARDLAGGKVSPEG